MKRQLVGLVLVFTACGATPEVTTSTTAGPAGSIAPLPSSTTTSTDPPTPSTSSQSGVRPASPILVSNADGVFQIDTDGTITQLVHGPVSLAIDDTQGGLASVIYDTTDVHEPLLVPGNVTLLHQSVETAGS